MILKLIVILVSSLLFYLGGKIQHNYRRFAMPLVLTSVCIFITHNFWLLLTMCLPTMATLTLGYGDKSPLRHIFGDGWGRGIWGLLAGLTLSLGLFLTGHLHLYWFLPYLGLNFTLENALKKIPQDIGDPIIGMGFGCIILLIK